MMRQPRGITLIDTLSVLLLVAAAAIYVWPVRVPAPEVSAVAAFVMPARMDTSSVQGADVAAIVSANILSASRRAPVSRYASPDRAGPSEFVMPAAFLPARDSSAAESSADAVPSLYGIVSIDGASRALLRLSESDVSPVLLREGDTRGAYRVVSIRSNAVIVAGPSGQRTLRLTKPARADSTGKQL